MNADNDLRRIVRQQFGAAIEMLENAIRLCPDANWDLENRFWFDVYHTLFFLDYYTTVKPVGFRSPAQFQYQCFDHGVPERTYTKEELFWYLNFCREKCFTLIADKTFDLLNYQWINESRTMRYSLLEILIYNMRHVQHHSAQLNLFLRQQINDAPDWVSREGEP